MMIDKINLVPESSWYQNLRSVLRDYEWAKLTKDIRKNAKSICQCCEESSNRLDIQEIWEFDDEKHIQKLAGVESVCYKCKTCFNIQLSKTTNEEAALRQYIKKISKISTQELDAILNEKYEAFNDRNQYDWILDVSWLQNNGYNFRTAICRDCGHYMTFDNTKGNDSYFCPKCGILEESVCPECSNTLHIISTIQGSAWRCHSCKFTTPSLKMQPDTRKRRPRPYKIEKKASKSVAKAFNKEQQQVIDTQDGYVLVIACPGSGKTTTIVNRTIGLLKRGVPSQRILIVTFTKAAASDMLKRFNSEVTSEYKDRVRFGTIHSTCLNIIEEAYGYTQKNVLPSDKMFAFFKRELSRFPQIQTMDKDDYIKDILTEISCVRNGSMDYRLYIPVTVEPKIFQHIYAAYEEFKRTNSFIDFDDMIILARDALRDIPALRNKWNKRYEYIMVDEFQDTNQIQAELIYMLAESYGNLCVVGDDDQSIYRFRQSTPELMLKFPKQFPDCTIIKMSTNYRSAPEIVKYASNIIQNNPNRFEKAFEAFQTEGAEISINRYDTNYEQTLNVISKIREFHRRGLPYDQMAVLYRTNSESNLLSAKLIESMIPFHSNDKVKDIHKVDGIFDDIIAYYHVATNRYTDAEFQRVLKRPGRYMSASVFAGCKPTTASMYDAFSRSGKPDSYIRQIKRFCDEMDVLRTKCNDIPAFLHYLMNVIGYRNGLVSVAEYYHRDVEEMQTTCDELVAEPARFNIKTFDEWIAYSAQYASNLQKQSKEEHTGVCLSTYHSSKGLEWDCVFLIDCNEGYIPHKMSKEDESIEEERRLFYVGFTRARKYLNLSYLNRNSKDELKISRFITESQLLQQQWDDAPSEKVIGLFSPDRTEVKHDAYIFIDSVVNGNTYGFAGYLTTECDEQILIRGNGTCTTPLDGRAIGELIGIESALMETHIHDIHKVNVFYRNKNLFMHTDVDGTIGDVAKRILSHDDIAIQFIHCDVFDGLLSKDIAATYAREEAHITSECSNSEPKKPAGRRRLVL